MFYSLRGKLIHTEPNLAVIECGGVGYKCLTTTTTVFNLPPIGSEATLYTYLHIREDALDLFGFYDQAELNCFKMLISVSGVGPKAGLSILSAMTPEKFALCVAANDAKSLTKSQGVGAKLAQRIILELKDKVANSDVARGVAQMPSGVVLDKGNAAEAISALVVLGYSQSDAATEVSKLDQSLSVEQMIKSALKILAAKM
ncbi:MAG TPA: Holliday junction branch migration protein RuvA [Ruminococcaceae bacterium]|nr:Holliday junction branch migration protein RuvA [Oscillospiraceae bacterium]